MLKLSNYVFNPDNDYIIMNLLHEYNYIEELYEDIDAAADDYYDHNDPSGYVDPDETELYYVEVIPKLNELRQRIYDLVDRLTLHQDLPVTVTIMACLEDAFRGFRIRHENDTLYDDYISHDLTGEYGNFFPNEEDMFDDAGCFLGKDTRG